MAVCLDVPSVYVCVVMLKVCFAGGRLGQGGGDGGLVGV